MATRSKRIGQFRATDASGREVLLVIHQWESDIMDAASRKWEPMLKIITTESGEPVTWKEKGVYVTKGGEVYRTNDPREPETD